MDPNNFSLDELTAELARRDAMASAPAAIEPAISPIDLDSLSIEELSSELARRDKLDYLNSQMTGAEVTAGMANKLLQSIPLVGTYADEALSGVNAAIDARPEFLGGSGISYSDAYDSRLAQIRDVTDKVNYQANQASKLGNLFIDVAPSFLAPMPKGLFIDKPGFINAGKNIAKGGALGAATGAVSGFGAGEGSIEDRAQAATTGAKWGGALGGGATAAGEILQGIGGAFNKTGTKLERESRGFRSSDFTKKNNPILQDEDGQVVGSKLAEVSDKLIAEGKLGKGFSRDATKLLNENLDQIEKLDDQLTPLIGKADEVLGEGVKVKPTYKNAKEWISEQPAAEQAALEKELQAVIDAQDSKLSGSLMSLQKEKRKLYKKSYSENGKARDVLNTYVAKDLKESIEGAVDKLAESGKLPASQVGQVKKINADMGDLLTVTPILKREFLASEGGRAMQFAENMLKTTPGRGASIVGLPLLGAMTGTLPATTALSLAVTALSTKTGAGIAGKTLKGLAPILEKSGIAATKGGVIGAYLGAKAANKKDPLTPAIDRLKSSPKIEFKKESAPMGKIEINPIALELKEAVKYQESRGKADAVSPKGATGLFQIMPATGKEIAEELGIKSYDLKDPKISEMFYEHYMSKKLKEFNNDAELALAAYNYGSGNVRKMLKRVNGTTFDDIKHLIPDETKKYVPQILARVLKNREKKDTTLV